MSESLFSLGMQAIREVLSLKRRTELDAEWVISLPCRCGHARGFHFKRPFKYRCIADDCLCEYYELMPRLEWKEGQKEAHVTVTIVKPGERRPF